MDFRARSLPSRFEALAADSGRIRRWLKIIVLLLGVVEALSQMHDTNPDAISYLDLGSAFWRGDPIWINGLWSPLYGIVCVGLLKLLHLSSAWEFAICHLVNFLMYALALLAFDLFLSRLLASIDPRPELSPSIVSSFFVLAFGIFLQWNHSLLVWLSPDLGVTACLLFAAALILRLKARPWDTAGPYLLGATLGVGYLCKSPVLPLGLSLLLALGFYLPSASRRFAVLVRASLVFLVLAGLYIVPLSLRSGRISTGESAQLNYGWHVQHVKYVHWQGDPVHGQPVHPTRLLMTNPEVFSFGEPLLATYAAYYDPSYWFAGMRTPFSVHDQLAAILVSMKEYGTIVFTWQDATLILLIIALLTLESAPGFRAYGQALREYLPLLLCCLFGVALFGIVHVEERYLTAFPVMALSILLAQALALQKKSAAIVRFIWIASFVASAATLIGMVPELGRGIAGFATIGKPDSNPAWVVARESRSFGLKSGERIAALGYSFHHSSWARAAGYRIVAEVPNIPEYWTCSDETRSKVDGVLLSAGARFLIADDVPAAALAHGWRPIGATGYFILPLAS